MAQPIEACVIQRCPRQEGRGQVLSSVCQTEFYEIMWTIVNLLACSHSASRKREHMHFESKLCQKRFLTQQQNATDIHVHVWTIHWRSTPRVFAWNLSSLNIFSLNGTPSRSKHCSVGMSHLGFPVAFPSVMELWKDLHIDAAYPLHLNLVNNDKSVYIYIYM